MLLVTDWGSLTKTQISQNINDFLIIFFLGFHAGIPENSVTKAKNYLICITLNKLRVM